MLVRGWRQLCSLRGVRPRISVRAWLTAIHKPCSSNEYSLDPLTSPIVMGWMKGSLHPPTNDWRGVKAVSFLKTATSLDGEAML
ncbi:hypothetical protein ACVIW2_005849 [Bradyrhizobium huanghuaihaiense]|uniref:Uncharacterized protein n=1 Tax=Bradyrhizobium huanghuaihaiense TaxID=990078 RepID=A0A562RMV6_9BRAD|nr:hypothetical protein IQ16_03544 [Bradyrhizobium huanghuaihaiense]